MWSSLFIQEEAESREGLLAGFSRKNGSVTREAWRGRLRRRTAPGSEGSGVACVHERCHDRGGSGVSSLLTQGKGGHVLF